MNSLGQDDTSSSLLTRARKQDRDGWLRLVEWIGPFILHWCRRGGLQEADRDEVSQQVLTRIWSGLKNFRKDNPTDSFRGWVYTITRNCIHDLLGKLRDAPRPLPAGLPPKADPTDAGTLQQRALHLIVRDLMARHADDRGFQAFRRTAVDGLTAGQASAELGLSADAVRQHKSRWIKRLRDQLREQYGELLG